ncbi:hypothetical protein H5410_030410 [Solanum commersonii]|uniref:Uncharacterized protein n=1 Tax=Solanum commersonii TaxID=4109 RepID=A0A9J5YHC1_SOLCO|nr:hypothetical protein H5410_030410 [Solanum commersonii]
MDFLKFIYTTGPSSTVDENPTTIIEDVISTFTEDPDIHTTGPSSTVEDIVSTFIEDSNVTQIHTTGPLSTVKDVIPTFTEDPNTTLSPLSSPDVTFIMPVDNMPQTLGRKKIVKRIVKNVNIKDLPAKKRKRDNEDEDGYRDLGREIFYGFQKRDA